MSRGPCETASLRDINPVTSTLHLAGGCRQVSLKLQVNKIWFPAYGFQRKYRISPSLPPSGRSAPRRLLAQAADSGWAPFFEPRLTGDVMIISKPPVTRAPVGFVTPAPCAGCGLWRWGSGLDYGVGDLSISGHALACLKGRGVRADCGGRVPTGFWRRARHSLRQHT